MTPKEMLSRKYLLCFRTYISVDQDGVCLTDFRIVLLKKEMNILFYSKQFKKKVLNLHFGIDVGILVSIDAGVTLIYMCFFINMESRIISSEIASLKCDLYSYTLSKM